MINRSSYALLASARNSRLTVQGFTLVELMVALALSLFLIGGLTVTYLSGRSAAMETEDLSRMQENIRFASDYLVRDIRNAGFRDYLTLSFRQYEMIGEQYAQYGDDQSELVVRYAGRGACGRVFADETELKVIENKYFVNDKGELRCFGKEIDVDGNVIPTGSGEPEERVTLAQGMSGISFEFLYRDGASPADPTVCDFYENDVLDDACIGVEMQLQFESEEPRVALLTAAFRNVIIDQVYERQ